MNFIGIDVGSTNIKCRLSTDQNVTLFTANKAYDLIHIDQYNYVDIQLIWHELVQMVKEASTYGDISAICITSFGESFALLDDQDRLILHPMQYTDPRGEQEMYDVLKLITKEDLYKLAVSIKKSFVS